MLRRLRLFLLLGLVPGAAGGILHVRGADGLPVAVAGYAVVLAAVAAFAFRTRGEVRTLARAAAER